MVDLVVGLESAGGVVCVAEVASEKSEAGRLAEVCGSSIVSSALFGLHLVIKLVSHISCRLNASMLQYIQPG